MRAPAIDLKPSRVQVACTLLTHGLALTGLWVATLPWWVACTLSLALVFSVGWHGLRYGDSSSRWFVSRIAPSAQGQWVLSMGDGKTYEGQLLRSFVRPWLVIVCFILEPWSRRSVVIFLDSADPNAIRRLRAHLTTATDSL